MFMYIMHQYRQMRDRDITLILNKESGIHSSDCRILMRAALNLAKELNTNRFLFERQDLTRTNARSALG